MLYPDAERMLPELEPRGEALFHLAVDLDQDLALRIPRTSLKLADAAVLDFTKPKVPPQIEQRAVPEELREGELLHDHEVEEAIR
jgi:hypothetical protein